MKRFPDWIDRLSEYMESVSKTPFQWGIHDCLIFSMRAVECMTGENYYSKYIGRYYNENDSKIVLREENCRSVVHLVEKHLPHCESVFSMKRGDVAVVSGVGGVVTLGICQGERIYCTGEFRLMTVPATHVKKAFQV